MKTSRETRVLAAAAGLALLTALSGCGGAPAVERTSPAPAASPAASPAIGQAETRPSDSTSQPRPVSSPTSPSTPVSSPASPSTPVTSPTSPSRPVTSPPGAGSGANPPTSPAAAMPAGPLAFRPVESSALPAALSAWRQGMEDSPTGAGAYADNALFVMAAAGEQRSGGYRVEIRGVEMNDGKVIVTALLHKPAPGGMVTAALTYPRAFARVELKGSGNPPVQVNWQ